MAKSLTISLEDEDVDRAERLAATRGLSVTEWVQELVAAATTTHQKPRNLGPITRSALGMLKGLPEKPYNELLTDALLEKYGLDK